MDILDDFKEEDKIMEKEHVTELATIMKKLWRRRISLEEYYRRAGQFWEDRGFPNWAEEIYERAKN